MSYLNSVTIIGFVGADPEQRQARNNNGSKFTVLSVATQRSWNLTRALQSEKTLVDVAGIEPATPCLQMNFKNAMWLSFLAFTYVVVHGF